MQLTMVRYTRDGHGTAYSRFLVLLEIVAHETEDKRRLKLEPCMERDKKYLSDSRLTKKDELTVACSHRSSLLLRLL